MKNANQTTLRSRTVLPALVVALCGQCGPPLLAQSPPPNYGIDFATIGSPGNRATIPSEVPFRPYMQVGSVGYQYRIATTEITATQWLDFVDAYAPYWSGSPSDPGFTSWWINPGPSGYQIMPGFEDCPVEISWRMAARYCNWLTNAKQPERSAFENGAYDTSTFTTNPDGTINDQHTRSAGAAFWIPSRDEWTKAAFYDLNRYGPGQDGYWLYPNAGNSDLISGLPSEGGQTNAGVSFPSSPQAMPVGSYPDVQSPWGLLDLSGGVREWTEDQLGVPSERWLLGTRMRENLPFDRLDWFGSTFGPDGPVGGLRIVSAVPEPGSAVGLFALIMLAHRRRR